MRDGPGVYRTARAAIREHGALQRLWELASLMGVVKRLRPRVVVEIGTHRGGSLHGWSRVAAPDALLVSIDLPTPEYGPERAGDLRRLLRPGQRLAEIRADSHDPATRASLLRILDGRPVDFLWIDGDHTEAGVRADWADYAPLVRPGGVAALHDIQYNPAFPSTRVDRLWAELADRHAARAFIDQDQPGGVGMGIGVVFL